MSRFRRLTPLLASRQGTRLMVPGYLDPRLTLTRAQAAGARSTALAADGVTWQDFGADVPRFNGAARRLMIGGQRTNHVRNMLGENAAGATIATNWQVASVPTGITLAYTRAVRNGVNGVEIAISGTTTSAANINISFEIGTPTTANGQTWTSSFFAQELVGNAGVTNLEILTLGETSGGSFVEGLSASFFASRAAFSRPQLAYTMANASTARASVRFRTNTIASGVNLSGYTIWLGWPQLEQGAFASSPALPLVGTPAASTRGADLVSAPLASLGIDANGACTIIGTFVLPQMPASGLRSELFGIDNETTANIIHAFVQPDGTIYFERGTASVYVGATTPGSVTANALFRAGMSLDGLGRAALSLNGVSVITVTGAPTSSLNVLRVGNVSIGTSPLHGEVGSLRVLPFPVSDTELQRLVAEQPT